MVEITSYEIAGLKKNQIMDVMDQQHGGYDRVGFTTKDLYNFCDQRKKQILADGDAGTLLKHLWARRTDNAGFYFDYAEDDKGHLKCLFWCDAQSRLDYQVFGDVLVFDSTYRTNRYNLPFIPFIGVNHHRSTVIFGCGILAQETTKAYIWLL